jgi:hypothetical protein
MSWDALSLGNKCLKSRPGRDCRLQFAITSLIEYAIARSVLMTSTNSGYGSSRSQMSLGGNGTRILDRSNSAVKENTRKHFS